MNKRFTVTQYNQFGYIHHKSYRFRWYARFVAWLHAGTSPLGVFTYTTTVTEES